ncbi:MAG: DUF554 domain-containing protein, partial [Defluviitaleaceae bacterium]|nr:DUF554 domain-containing protein [Defluviitaleaceae bacterium]
AAMNGGASTLLLIMSLVVGGFLGAIIDVDHKFGVLAIFIERKISRGREGLAKGFVTGTILYCVGTMAILGSIESGVLGNHDILFAKAILDGISAIVLAAAFGPGVLLSAVSVLFYQGVITLAAGAAAAFITEEMMVSLAAIGGTLIFAIGLNMLEITKIKLANFLPAIFIPMIFYAIF